MLQKAISHMLLACFLVPSCKATRHPWATLWQRQKEWYNLVNFKCRDAQSSSNCYAVTGHRGLLTRGRSAAQGHCRGKQHEDGQFRQAVGQKSFIAKHAASSQVSHLLGGKSLTLVVVARNFAYWG